MRGGISGRVILRTLSLLNLKSPFREWIAERSVDLNSPQMWDRFVETWLPRDIYHSKRLTTVVVVSCKVPIDLFVESKTESIRISTYKLLVDSVQRYLVIAASLFVHLMRAYLVDKRSQEPQKFDD